MLSVAERAVRKRRTLRQLSGTIRSQKSRTQHSRENKCEQMEDIEFESFNLCPRFYFQPIYVSTHIRMKGDIRNTLNLLSNWAFQSFGYTPKMNSFAGDYYHQPLVVVVDQISLDFFCKIPQQPLFSSLAQMEQIATGEGDIGTVSLLLIFAPKKIESSG